jgi:hypothetical protein
MSVPQNHHWLPQFFMAPWCGKDGLVQSFYRPYDKVVSRRKSLKSLASEPHLYTANWRGFNDPLIVERTLQKLEDSGAKVRKRLLAGEVNELTFDERESFAVVVSLLLARRPELLRPHQESAEGYWQTEKHRILSAGHQGAPVSVEEIEKLDGYFRDSIFIAMIESTATLARSWLSFPWRVFDVSDGGFNLVLSDRPITMWGDNGHISCLTLPISPTKIFAAGNFPPQVEISFLEKFRQSFVLDCIRHQFTQASRFVIATDNGRNGSYLKVAEMFMHPAETASSTVI